MPTRFNALPPTFFSSMNSYWSLSLVPAVGAAGLYMISVMANCGVDTMNVPAVGPDHELLRGGLFAPMRLWWAAFQFRATTRALLVSVTVAVLRPDKALGETAPPASRGSVPSSV